jgi:hypothetical protein
MDFERTIGYYKTLVGSITRLKKRSNEAVFGGDKAYNTHF